MDAQAVRDVQKDAAKHGGTIFANPFRFCTLIRKFKKKSGKNMIKMERRELYKLTLAGFDFKFSSVNLSLDGYFEI